MISVGSRKRNQAAPRDVLFDALVEPGRPEAGAWLALQDGEQAPHIVEAHAPGLVIWSSLWVDRPDAQIRFDLDENPSGNGTDLRWTLMVAQPEPEPEHLGRLRRRINELVNDDLRATLAGAG